MDNSSKTPPLGSTDRDHAVGMLKAATSAIPVAGGIIAELIGMTIPQQRIERLEAYVRHLTQRLDESKLGEMQNQPTAIDLFEDGAYQSVRALSDERRERIVSLVANGIEGDEAARLEAKRLLNLLSEIGDDQIIELLSHTYAYSRDESFFEKHKSILEPVHAHMGSSREEIDKDVMRKLRRDQLTRLGLLKPRFALPRKGEMPELDPDTGTAKMQGLDVTPLGRLLLNRLGLLGPDQL